jgi:hypothetical protein
MNKEEILKAFTERSVVTGIIEDKEYIEGQISLVSINETYVIINPDVENEIDIKVSYNSTAKIRVAGQDYPLSFDSIFINMGGAKEAMTMYFYDQIAKIQTEIDRLKIPIQTEAKASEVKL